MKVVETDQGQHVFKFEFHSTHDDYREGVIALAGLQYAVRAVVFGNKKRESVTAALLHSDGGAALDFAHILSYELNEIERLKSACTNDSARDALQAQPITVRGIELPGLRALHTGLKLYSKHTADDLQPTVNIGWHGLGEAQTRIRNAVVAETMNEQLESKYSAFLGNLVPTPFGYR